MVGIRKMSFLIEVRVQSPALSNGVSEFIAIFYTEFHNDVSPATALHSNIKATRPSESHLVRLNPCIEQLV